MGEAKKRGSFDERKKQSLELESHKKEESLQIKQNEKEEQEIYSKKLLAFANSQLQSGESRLLQFTQSIEESLTSKNYFAALIMALTLPDICCSIESENRRTRGTKYAKWFKKYVGYHYVSQTNPVQKGTVFLSGEECYALRCAYLHKGINDIEAEDIVKNYGNSSKRIEFMAETQLDQNIINGILILKLELFCQRIIEGVRLWLAKNKYNPSINLRMLEIPQIHTAGLSLMSGVFIDG